MQSRYLNMLHDSFYEVGESEYISTYFKGIDLNSPIWQTYMGWESSIIPMEAVLLEPVLSELNTKFPIEGAAVLKMNPMQCYKWHRDSDRRCSVNMLLENRDSVCLFGEDIDGTSLTIKKLDYKVNTLYLLNTQQPHTVINYEGMRYMFTVKFAMNPSFEEVVRSIEYKPCNEFSRLI